MMSINYSITKSITPEIVWRMADDNIYLTFDDGPDREITPRLLSLFAKLNIKATFFLIGQKAEQYPEIVMQLIQSEHTIGNHSYSHPRLLWLPKEKIKHELQKTDEILYNVTGQKPVWFRPPYGQFGPRLLNVLKNSGHKMALWSASARDYAVHSNVQTIQRRLSKSMRPGQIIVLHDGHRRSSNTLRALENSLHSMAERGLTFAALKGS